MTVSLLEVMARAIKKGWRFELESPPDNDGLVIFAYAPDGSKYGRHYPGLPFESEIAVGCARCIDENTPRHAYGT
jgi:hypothetical protein